MGPGPSVVGRAAYGNAPLPPPKKYSVRIDGHRTSISLEPLFWDKLTTAARMRNQSINALVAQIDAERIRAETPPGLAGAILHLAGHL
ncbi:ribbon-helix-helix domain-containing protein [Qipengyuania sp. HL-TH1]|uniref:ribbon-helix-helix domain-containing protein n=1 Tax=Qipengyuania profunda TaxID=3113984 RepID=UPI002A18CE6D|nr:ribbon-helix-helix domain-containing protein [Qipengyuania sp. HL-TH1]WPL58561.1 ribbon-helix-helix domain-containing protein [Qipengyuania sp. HL-TH5]